jgi:hypothetical protein
VLLKNQIAKDAWVELPSICVQTRPPLPAVRKRRKLRNYMTKPREPKIMFLLFLPQFAFRVPGDALLREVMEMGLKLPTWDP